MGRPAHYSIDVVARCQVLIDRLLPTVARGQRGDEFFGGPLTTTFLLSMAIPMINLPVERLLKPAQNNAGVADDTDLPPEKWPSLN